MKRILLFLATILASATVTNAQCLIKHVPLSSKIANSSLVVEGKVVDKTSFWDNNHKNIFTRNKVEVYKIFKGSLQGNYVEIITEGGIVGNDMHVVEPSLQLSIGQIGIFSGNFTNVNIPFTQTSSAPQLDPYASVQGFIKYDLNTLKASAPFENYSNIQTALYPTLSAITNTSYQVVKKVNFTVNQSMQVQASISSINPTTATAGTKTQLTISGSGFGSLQGSGYVEFADANSGGVSTYTPGASQYVSWNDNTIIVEIPSRAGTGTINVVQGTPTTSTQTLTVTYSQLNANSGGNFYPTHHIDDNGSGGYTFNMFTGFDGNAAAKASFLRAMDTWRCATGVNWVNGSTTSTDAIASDGENLVRFDIGAELPGGVLGRCTSRYTSCDGSTWDVDELDVVFDDGTSWEYGPAVPSGGDFDFESVALHELGHGHQLGHVIASSTDVMHYSFGPNSTKRTLTANNQAAGTHVQGESTTNNGCGDPMTNYSCGGTPVANFSASTTTGCAGSSITFTDLSTNTPTSWSWTFAGGTPSTSSLQNPVIVYNTPGVYNVTLTATNGSGSDNEVKVGYITIGSCTRLRNSNCGTTLASMNSTFSCNLIASATSYEFRFRHTATSFTSTKVKNTSVCAANEVPGLQYGRTYDVDVRARVAGVWGSYGTICQLSTPAVMPPTQLRPTSCGATLTNLTNQIHCNAVAGATNYEFRFIHSATSFTTTIVKQITYCIGSTVSGLQYGKTYDVSVRAKVGGVWGSYGPVCQLTTPAVMPNVQLSTSSCGVTLANMTDDIYSTVLPGAIQYEFRFIHAASSFTATVVKVIHYCRANQISGLQPNTTYDVDVRANVGGSWGTYGPDCQITTPGAGIAPFNDGRLNVGGNISYNLQNEENNIYKNQDESTDKASSLKAEVFPNPSYDGNIILNIHTANLSDETATVSLFDLSGRELTIKQHPIMPGTITTVHLNLSDIVNVAGGIYFIKISSGNLQVFKKLVIE